MNRMTIIALSALALGLPGCSSMNVFGSAPKPQPVATADASGAAAAPAPKPRQPRLKRFDENQDGGVTKAELESTLQSDFKKEDVNQNQSLDTVEARALNERLREEEGTSPVFDWNADGKLVYAEFATQWRTLFDRFDRNQDGTVDEDEMTNIRTPREPRKPPPPTFSGKDGRAPGYP
jgi:Ca2+-binding EF-hand superfamily protein